MTFPFIVLGVVVLGIGWMLFDFYRECKYYERALKGPIKIPETIPAPVREIDPAEVVRRIEKKQEREWEAEFESLLPKPEPEPIEYTNYCCCDSWTQRNAGGSVVLQSRTYNPRCGVHRNPWE